MEQITLTQETISAIRAYFDNPELCEGNATNLIDDAEFQQGDYTIFVDALLYCHLEHKQMVHNEVTPPNIEDLSEYVLDGYEIMGIQAYDQDRKEVEISNINNI